METIPAIADILTWPQAIFGIVVVLAVLVVPQVMNLLQNRAIKHELKPNSGSSTRDAIDRIERKLDQHIEAEAARNALITDRLHKLDGN